MPVFQKLESAGVPVKIWTRDIDEAALRQLCNVASLPPDFLANKPQLSCFSF